MAEPMDVIVISDDDDDDDDEVEEYDISRMLEETATEQPNLDLVLGPPSNDFFEFYYFGHDVNNNHAEEEKEGHKENDFEIGQSSSKRPRPDDDDVDDDVEFVKQVKGKAKVIEIDDTSSSSDDDRIEAGISLLNMAFSNNNNEYHDSDSLIIRENTGLNLNLSMNLNLVVEQQPNVVVNDDLNNVAAAAATADNGNRGLDLTAWFQGNNETEQDPLRRHYKEIAKNYANHIARSFQESIEKNKASSPTPLDEEIFGDSKNPTPFSIALETIKKRTERRRGVKSVEDLISWVPRDGGGDRNVAAPSLLELSLKVLAKNADKIVSLELIPDELKQKLSYAVSTFRKMDSHFVELLARGSPREIRVKGCSNLKEKDFHAIFDQFDGSKLELLQLDLCGECVSDYGLQYILNQSGADLPLLVTLSLRGAFCLSSSALKCFSICTPALRSVNLSESLVTSEGITGMISHLRYTMRELYLDDCRNIDAMNILPVLKKLKNLEVLSVAGSLSVCDSFVKELVEVCGVHIKELGLARCRDLTDKAIIVVGRNCPELHAIDLSHLALKDLAMRFLSNGCRSIHRLTLFRNGFSDEAIAAFLESSGQSLIQLSLNSVKEVGLHTAVSLSRCSKNLLSLDLSWCRNLTDDALGLIVDGCLSLKMLKIFGCSQITERFVNGHSNSFLQIVGLPSQPLVSDLVEPQPQR